jgi:hypothetical protein
VGQAGSLRPGPGGAPQAASCFCLAYGSYDALNLSEGTRLTVDVRGQEIALSKEAAWRKLKGAAAGRDLMSAFAAFKKQESEREDLRS